MPVAGGEHVAERRAPVAAPVVYEPLPEVGVAKRPQNVLPPTPNAVARSFSGRPGRITEADALIAYLQHLGNQVDFKLYDNKANIR